MINTSFCLDRLLIHLSYSLSLCIMMCLIAQLHCWDVTRCRGHHVRLILIFQRVRSAWRMTDTSCRFVENNWMSLNFTFSCSHVPSFHISLKHLESRCDLFQILFFFLKQETVLLKMLCWL